jgi:butyryl-CoA dehydrogenase
MNFDFNEEQVMFRKMAKEFAEREMLPTLLEHERSHKVNHDLSKKMGSMGLIGAHLPDKYGGLGLDLVTACVVWEQLSSASWTQTLTAIAPGVLAGTIISKVASEEKRQKYLPLICKGEFKAAVAAVEPTAGSDAAAVETTATLDGDSWVLNGSKVFVTDGGIADMLIALVQTDKKLGPKGLALVSIDKGTPGLSVADVGMVGDKAGDMVNAYFIDCRVPKENLMGDIGRGLQNALVGIDMARLFISASAIGMAQSCLDSCVKYAKERMQFGRLIGSFQLIQETIARMQAEIQTIRWQVYYAADLKHKGAPHGKELSAAKWLATECAVKSSAEAIRLHGAYGCSDEYPIEHHYRDSIMATILGGTTEVHKLTIGRELLEINAMK